MRLTEQRKMGAKINCLPCVVCGILHWSRVYHVRTQRVEVAGSLVIKKCKLGPCLLGQIRTLVKRVEPACLTNEATISIPCEFGCHPFFIFDFFGKYLYIQEILAKCLDASAPPPFYITTWIHPIDSYSSTSQGHQRVPSILVFTLLSLLYVLHSFNLF